MSEFTKAQIEKLIADHNADMAACHEQFMEVSREAMSLKAELEAARKDAERYRLIRSKLYDGAISIGEAYLTLRVVGSCPTLEQFDAAIEQAKEGCQHEWDSDGDPGPGETMTLRCRYCGEEEQAKGA